jgi:hypothetical protein
MANIMTSFRCWFSVMLYMQRANPTLRTNAKVEVPGHVQRCTVWIATSRRLLPKPNTKDGPAAVAVLQLPDLPKKEGVSQGLAVCWGTTVVYLNMASKQPEMPTPGSLRDAAVAVLQRPDLPKSIHHAQSELQILFRHNIEVAYTSLSWSPCKLPYTLTPYTCGEVFRIVEIQT